MSDPPGLYVHVPFCSGKCAYCDFYSVASPRLAPAWLDAVLTEARLYRDSFPAFGTLFLGGGTPSRLSDAQLEALLDGLRSCFRLDEGAEITLEANPEDVTRPRASRLLALGFNRVSLGVQSFDDADLAFLGRRHEARDSLRAVDALREAGCLNVSLDLIYGLPGRTEEAWLRTLDRALAHAPEHLSCYALTVERGTRLGLALDRGLWSRADDETTRAQFLASSRRLTGNGYVHYEVSNFASSPARRCVHNLTYWRRGRYLGLGPAAHSFDGGSRRWNHRSVKRYCDDLKAGRRPVAGQETITPEEARLEALYLGLRMQDGVPTASLAHDAETVLSLTAEGLAVVTEDRLVLTPEGLVVSDAIAERLWQGAGPSRIMAENEPARPQP